MHYIIDMSKKQMVKALEECGAIQFGRFVLTSGAISDYYIDIKKASTNPFVLKKIAEITKGKYFRARCDRAVFRSAGAT